MNKINLLQYIIGIIIFVIFLVSLIPGVYVQYYQILLLLILVQMLISISNGKIINFFFEIILLIFSLIIAIPILFSSIKSLAVILAILVYVFKIVALPIAWLDFSIFKGSTLYQNFKYVNKFETIGNNSKKEKKSTKKKPEFQDAEFEEK